jgi:hypothetical protein
MKKVQIIPVATLKQFKNLKHKTPDQTSFCKTEPKPTTFNPKTKKKMNQHVQLNQN